MKKVGIVSCYFKNNYGSMLQAYATQKILDNNGIPNETISIDENIDFKKGKRKYYISQIFNFSFIKSKFGMIKMKIDIKLNKALKKNIATRNKKYLEFRKEFNLTKMNRTYNELSQMADIRYTDVIVGSDQLWLPVNVVADYYTLNWVSDKINKVSYATSFGVSSIKSKYFEIYRKFLTKINHLSVREDTGVKLVKEIANIEANLVCDPTILLTKEDWDKIATPGRIIKEKYIFCYFLGNNIEHRKFVERLKAKTGYTIVSINHCDEYVRYSDKYCDFAPYDVGPREWISLIKNAVIVCTDSFHGTVFSLLYNKQFFCFTRFKNNSKASTNSRIYSLLKVAGVKKERILTGLEEVTEVTGFKIDYSVVNKNIEKYRNDSIEWLLESITYKKKNKNSIDITYKEECCGCTACKNNCPQKAIEMKADAEGFLYPIIDEKKCVNCGLCKKTCPILNKIIKNEFNPRAFLFQNKDESIRADSTSGGFSSAVGSYVIQNSGIVYGAGYNEEFVVEHQKAKTVEELSKFRKSKYSQSCLKDTFKQVKNELENDNMVCFMGTPCQVAGLKQFLQVDYKKLILVDLMCHSVPSPLVFEKYKNWVLSKLGATEIMDVNFRDKSKYGYKYSMMTVKTNKGVYSEGIDKDPYLRAFFGDYSVRPSCYECKFKTLERVSDITIWDCFNINEIDKSFDDDKGTTRILAQSEKGYNLLKKLNNVRLKEIELGVATRKVKEMTQSVKSNPKREMFFRDINDTKVMEKYFPITIRCKINGLIRRTLSNTGLYSTVKSMAKKVLGK